MDLDDTLLKSDLSISSYTVETLKEAQRKGFRLVFNTSRSYSNSKKYIDIIHPDYGIYNGGCQIFDNKNNELYSLSISAEETKRLTKMLYQVCDKISLQTKDSFLASDKSYKGQNAKWFDFKDGYYGEAYKILCFSDNHDLIKQIAIDNKLEYQNYLGGNWHRLSIEGGSKILGLKALMKIVDGKLDEAMTFGDDYGDIEMIENSGVGVAMGNAREEVKKKASFIALDNDEDGVAKFVSESLLVSE